MEYDTLKLENGYIIRIEKEKIYYKVFNNNASYNCRFIIIDSLNKELERYNCSEIEFISIIDAFYWFDMNIESTYSDRVYIGLNENLISGIIELNYSNFDIDTNIIFKLYEESQNGIINKLSFKISILELEELTLMMYMLIYNIENINDYTYSDFKEFIEEY